jgi:hypothetical protein
VLIKTRGEYTIRDKRPYLSFHTSSILNRSMINKADTGIIATKDPNTARFHKRLFEIPIGIRDTLFRFKNPCLLSFHSMFLFSSQKHCSFHLHLSHITTFVIPHVSCTSLNYPQPHDTPHRASLVVANPLNTA